MCARNDVPNGLSRSSRGPNWSVSEARQRDFVRSSRPTCDFSRSSGNEPGLNQHPLRGNIVITDYRPKCPQPMFLSGNPAQVSESGSR
jgi:hypothetical protein